jgi:iron complex transport system substrate-binding protein
LRAAFHGHAGGHGGAVGSITKGSKVVRYLFAMMGLLVGFTCAHTADVKDATGRTVMVPDRVERVMAAGPTAAVVLYVLAPEKMIAWPSAPRPNEREFILPAVRDLPEFGRLTGRHRGRD